MHSIKKAWAEGRVVQYRDPTGKWVSWLNDKVLNLDASNEWREYPSAYVTIYGRAVPRPLDPRGGALPVGQVYYIPHLRLGWQACVWEDTKRDYELLRSNLIHLSPTAAEHHTAAIKSIFSELPLD